MKTEFTPGKWVARSRSMSDGSLVIMDELHTEIACIRDKSHRTYGPQDDCDKANARLIAAAPDLIFALKYILAQSHLGHIHDTASAALSKALGHE